MTRMTCLSRCLAVVALATASAASHAVDVFVAPSFAGDVTVSGFGIVGPGPTLPDTGTFTMDLSDLSGSLGFQTVPDGHYTLSVGGSIDLSGFGPVPISATLPPTPVYTGFLGSSGLTPGAYGFAFGSPLGVDIPFGFTLDYDGNASPQVMAALALLGLPFVDSAGAGQLTVAGTFFADGTSAQLVFTEDNLTWVGFANTLALVDAAYGGNNGVMDGSFALSDVVVTAVPEPASLLLFGAGLLGLQAARRRAGA